MRIALFDKNEYDDIEAYKRFGKVTCHTRYNGGEARGADITFTTYSRPPDGPGLIVNMDASDADHLSNIREATILQAPDWYGHEVARWTLTRIPNDPSLRVAVIGRGRIGRRVYRFLRMRGYRVTAYPHTLQSLPAVHLVTLHVRLSPRTRGWFGPRYLVNQRGLILLNCARRQLVDDSDLRDALRKGQVARASLDLGKDFGDPRVEVTPHVAWKGPWAAKRRPLVILKFLRDYADGRLARPDPGRPDPRGLARPQ